jgi:iron complex outermembrane recepter protein
LLNGSRYPENAFTFIYMNRLLLSCLSLFLSVFALAQELPVKFTVVGSKGEPLAAATVTIVPAADSMAKKNGIADSAGTIVFNLLQNSLYTVRVSSINYESLEKNITIKGEKPVFKLVAQPLSKSMSSVVVTARRPLMRQEDDKTIVDPEPIANVSTNAYEILEKTPGLFVDQDGNIYLSSTTPAKVYINGREQRMSAADIATILKSLPPNAISTIEIMRMPSAKYDASGSGGIVNVVLRKGVRIGLTGSVHTGFNQGRYGNQFAGININNSSGPLTTYLNINASRRNSFEELTTDRKFAPDSVLSQDALTKYPANSYYIGYGINYSINDKWEWSYDGRVNYNINKSNSVNESVKKQISTQNMGTQTLAGIDNNGKNFSVNQGMNLKYKIDSLGSTWTTDLSFTYSPNNTDQQFTTELVMPVHYTFYGDARIENKYRFLSANTDLSKKLKGQVTVEAGLKSTAVWFDNSNNYYNNLNGSRVKDHVRTGAYNYRENINAAYGQVSKTFGGVVLKVGTRLENTNMNGHQVVPRDTAFSVNRTDFFPYVYLSKSLLQVAGFDLKGFLIYRRTINRPAYEFLNPSPRYIDPYLFESGNPALRPQFTNTYEANISVDERPIFAVGINETKDIFNQVVYQADSNRSQAYRTYDNLGKNKETYLRLLGAIPPGGKYFFVAGAQYNHNFYQGAYETKPLSFKRGSWRFFTYHNLKATETTNIFLNGFLMTNGQLQFYEISTFGQLNMGISQQLFQKKLTMNLFLQDMLYTNQNEFVLNQGSVSATGTRKSDTRRVGLFLRYNFGMRKKEQQQLPNLDAGNQQKP